MTLIDGLHRYSVTQIILLPDLTATNVPGKTTFKEYIDTHAEQIKDMDNSTTIMKQRHAAFQSQWQDADNNIVKSIKEEQQVCSTMVESRALNICCGSLLLFLENGCVRETDLAANKQPNTSPVECLKDYWRPIHDHSRCVCRREYFP